MLQQFFMLCSGADTDILKTCSKGEQNKYAGIGATVFFTAVMAFIASAYALFTVFDNIYTSIFFGLIWGLLIFNLDRFIVSTIKKSDSFKSELLQATPRIILAVIIAIVISKPLEMKIFEKEINQVLLEEKNSMTLANKEQIATQYTPKTEQLKADILGLKNEIATKEVETNALYDTYISEAEGTAGTKLLGKGPVYKEKRDKHDAALAELQSLKQTNAERISTLESQIAALDLEYVDQVTNTQPIIDGFDGLMAAYDYKLEDQESAVRTWVTQKVGQREKVLETDTLLNNKIYGEIAEEEEIYKYKKQKAEELLKLQANAFHEVQVKSL